MTVSYAGAAVPSMAGFRTAMVVAAVVAALAAGLALLIPVSAAEATEESVEVERQRL